MLDTIILLLIKLKFKITLKKDYLYFKSSFYKLCDRISIEFENADQGR